MNRPEGSSPESQISASSGSAPQTASGFSSKRVFLVLFPIVAIALAGAAIAAYGLPAPLAAWFEPELVHTTGQVFFEGKPVSNGVILTVPLDGQPAGTLAAIGEDGRFTLQTDIGGHFVDGAYVGRHKLAVSSGRPRMMGIIPLVPEKYFTLADTDLTIDVTSSPEQNHFEFKLEGELTEEAQRALGRIQSGEQGQQGQQRPNVERRPPGGPPGPPRGNARPEPPTSPDSQETK